MYDELECSSKKGHFSSIVWINAGLYWSAKCMAAMSCFDIVSTLMDIYIAHVHIRKMNRIIKGYYTNLEIYVWFWGKSEMLWFINCKMHLQKCSSHSPFFLQKIIWFTLFSVPKHLILFLGNFNQSDKVTVCASKKI